MTGVSRCSGHPRRKRSYNEYAAKPGDVGRPWRLGRRGRAGGVDAAGPRRSRSSCRSCGRSRSALSSGWSCSCVLVKLNVFLDDRGAAADRALRRPSPPWQVIRRTPPRSSRRRRRRRRRRSPCRHPSRRRNSRVSSTHASSMPRPQKGGRGPDQAAQGQVRHRAPRLDVDCRNARSGRTGTGAGRAPLMVSMPHVGTHVPPASAAQLTDAPRAVPDTDWHLPRLYDFLPTSSALPCSVATHSRYVIDLNRPPDSRTSTPARTRRPVPRRHVRREPLYRRRRRTRRRSPRASMRSGGRITGGWRPNWSALRRSTAPSSSGTRIRSRSVLPRFFEGRLTDLNLGTADGASCDPALAEALLRHRVANRGYTAVLNGRFKGGYITRQYGNPARRRARGAARDDAGQLHGGDVALTPLFRARASGPSHLARAIRNRPRLGASTEPGLARLVRQVPPVERRTREEDDPGPRGHRTLAARRRRHLARAELRLRLRLDLRRRRGEPLPPPAPPPPRPASSPRPRSATSPACSPRNRCTSARSPRRESRMEGTGYSSAATEVPRCDNHRPPASASSPMT